MNVLKFQPRSPHEEAQPEDDELVSFPKPPPLPRERAAMEQAARERAAQAKANIPPPPPLTQSMTVEPPPPLAEETRPPAPTTATDVPSAPPTSPAEFLPTPPAVTGPSQQPDATGPSGPAATGDRRRLYALGAALLVGFGIAGLLFVNRSDEPAEITEEPVAEALAETPVEALVGGGQLLIDARPWGMISRLLDAEGHAVDLPEERQTPLVLALDPGRYTALLTHPNLNGAEVSCAVEVTASAGATCRPDLLMVDVETYWEAVGWWR